VPAATSARHLRLSVLRRSRRTFAAMSSRDRSVPRQATTSNDAALSRSVSHHSNRVARGGEHRQTKGALPKCALCEERENFVERVAIDERIGMAMEALPA
jgi:hypothetical protein